MERHFQTLIGAILIGLVAWTGLSVTKSLEAVARLDERVLNLSHQMTKMEAIISSTYSEADAVRDFGFVYKQIGDLDIRVKELEKKNRSYGK